MDCQRFASALRDHAAGAELTSAAQAHLQQCEACRGELARERALVARIDADVTRALGVQASAGFEARVRQHVASQPASGWVGGWMTGWRVGLAAASLVIVALAVGAGLRWDGTPGRAGRSQLAAANTGGKVANERGREALVSPEPPRATVARNVAPSGVAVRPELPQPVSRQRVERTAGGQREPQVLVAADQRVAIARLFAIASGRVLDDRTTDDLAPGAVPIVVEELRVAPIVVAPSGGDRQQ